MAGWAYRDVAARRSVTEILKHFFPSFFSRCCCCCCLCHRLSAILLAVLESDFSVFCSLFFATAAVVVVNLLPEKSRREIYATKRCQ